MIQNLQIKNFQSHKNSTLEFSPGVNIITGPTDNGKSAIIRALRWVAWNRPGGDAFRSEWGGNTHVSIETETHGIARNKGDVNSYVLRELGEEEVLEFKAFGTDVPDEIKNVLNLDEINLQSQLDTPFLLTESAGQVAAHFNKIAGIDLIDSSLKAIKKEISKSTSLIEQRQDDLKEVKLSIAKFENIEKLETALELLEQKEKDKINQAKKIRNLTLLIDSLEGIQVKLTEKEPLLKYENKVNTLLEQYAQLREDKVVENLQFIITSYERVTKLITKKQIYVSLESKTENLLQKYSELSQIKADTAILNDLLISFTTLTEREAKTVEKHKELHTLFEKNMPDVCPLCEIPLNKTVWVK